MQRTSGTTATWAFVGSTSNAHHNHVGSTYVTSIADPHGERPI